IEEIFNQYMKELADELFTEFHHAAFNLGKDDKKKILSILTWRGEDLPQIYKDLQIVDEKGNILINRAVLSKILSEVNRREDSKNNKGSDIANFFDAPPHGWDSRIVRLGLVALFKNGSIRVIYGGKEYTSPTEKGCHDAFGNAREFNKAIFLPGEIVTPQQRDEASQLVSEIFGINAGQNIEQIADAIDEILNATRPDCERLKTICIALDLPIKSELKDLSERLGEISKISARTSKILAFINEDRIEIIRKHIPTLRKFREFEQNKNIDKYKEIESFIKDVGPQLKSVLKDDQSSNEYQKTIENLKNNLNSNQFLNIWDTIITEYQKLNSCYVKVYKETHKNRNGKVQDHLSQIHITLNPLTLPSKDNEQLLSPLESLKCVCTNLESIKESPFICSECKSSLKDINYHIEIIDKRSEEILNKIKEISEKIKTNKQEIFKKTKFLIKDNESLAELTQNISNFSQKAIDKSKNVLVDLRMVIQDNK
ncbi:MAG: hypothetical protein ACTSRG_22840, partial [Candidatus Helarchaeota archaeon]